MILIHIDKPRGKIQYLLKLRGKYHFKVQSMLNFRGNIIRHKDSDKIIGARLRITKNEVPYIVPIIIWDGSIQTTEQSICQQIHIIH